MSETSRQVVYIPTVWPTERQFCRKRRQQMDLEGIDGDSTDVWTKNIIQRYEERPESLEQVYLAEFASWYEVQTFVVTLMISLTKKATCRWMTMKILKLYPKRGRREHQKNIADYCSRRVIRYRRYDFDETVNYKREMVVLYVQFRNEMSEIVDQNKFLNYSTTKRTRLWDVVSYSRRI